MLFLFSHNSIFGPFLAGFTAAAATAKTATSYEEQHNQKKRDRHRNAYSGVFVKPPANKACVKVKLADWYVLFHNSKDEGFHKYIWRQIQFFSRCWTEVRMETRLIPPINPRFMLVPVSHEKTNMSSLRGQRNSGKTAMSIEKNTSGRKRRLP